MTDNELIKRFMGLNTPTVPEYDKSWEALMSVSIKILGCRKGELGNDDEDLEYALSNGYHIEDVYPTIVKFVKWYNEVNNIV